MTGELVSRRHGESSPSACVCMCVRVCIPWPLLHTPSRALRTTRPAQAVQGFNDASCKHERQMFVSRASPRRGAV